MKGNTEIPIQISDQTIQRPIKSKLRIDMQVSIRRDTGDL